MKTILSIGCATIALALGCSPAFAQAKFDVKLSGDAYFAFGYIGQQQDTGLRNTEFTNRYRLNIVPTAKADNGLEYGARLRIRADRANGQVDADKAYIFAEAGFGRVELGLNSGIADNAFFFGPADDFSANGLGSGIDTPHAPFDNFLGGSAMGAYVLNSQIFEEPRGVSSVSSTTRVAYYSPRYLGTDDKTGVQFGASFFPKIDSYNTDVNRRNVIAAPTGAQCGGGYYCYDNVYEVGLNYLGEYGDISVDGDIGYIGGTTRNTVPAANYANLSSFKVGADIKYKGVKFGGSYLNAGKSGTDTSTPSQYQQDQQVYIVGIAYIQDAYAVGFTYTGVNDSGHDALAKVNFNIYTVGGTYNVAPGLAVSLDYNYIQMRSNNQDLTMGGIKNDNASLVTMRAALAF